MLAKGTAVRKATSEGERPFWISYADLMTAMMMLFLVVMAATIVALMRKEAIKISAEELKKEDLARLCEDLKREIGSNQFVKVDCADNRITFPDLEVGYFRNNEYRLPENSHPVLAELVPAILRVSESDIGKKWLKRVIVEGYASRRGRYLMNLNLSMKRSYWVMCLLADPGMNSSLQLTTSEAQRVRELFRVGGASFNKPRDSEEMSRRVEFQLEFYQSAGGDPQERADSLSGAVEAGPDPCDLR